MDHAERHLIAELRRVGHQPPRTLADALRVASRQAKNLLLITETYEPPVDPAILLADPKVAITYTGELRRVSGVCQWVGSRYLIAVNRREPVQRQRFTVFHEFKHALDGARVTEGLNRFSREGKRPAAEFVADYFASCVLMPEWWVMDAVKHARDLEHLARYFGVSKDAMRIRLESLGLDRGLVEAKVR
jgi:Zn-dependent peptidase ImmA (M78 family)